MVWKIRGWDAPDLSYARAVAHERGSSWPAFEPQLLAVQCGRKVKHALYLRVGPSEFQTWATAVEPRQFIWRWHRTVDHASYVVLRFSLLFEDPRGGAIGFDDGQGTITVTTRAVMERSGHRARCSTMFDPGDPAQRAAIEAWAKQSGPLMLFFIEPNNRHTAYGTVDLPPEARAVTLENLSEAQHKLEELTDAGDFTAAREELLDSLPTVTRW
jgi:hypothetical protein